MDRNNPYFKQAKLLVQILPYIAEHDCFALKGGTAINLFVRNLPRLSVDIDLVYVPVADRQSSLAHIDNELRLIESALKNGLPGLTIVNTVLKDTFSYIKLVAQYRNANVKIEVSPVARGTVFGPVKMDVCNRAEEMFGFASANLASFEDLFAGKICAALDRQHPRDLFDIKLLFEREGITSKLFSAFLVYLTSSNRPIVELLKPSLSDIKQEYIIEFNSMSLIEVSLKELIETRNILLSHLHSMLENRHKEFLISFKQGNPQWHLLGLSRVEELPAVKWKLYNLKQMDSAAHKSAIEKLEKALFYSGA